jgi:hypothetical protein
LVNCVLAQSVLDLHGFTWSARASKCWMRHGLVKVKSRVAEECESWNECWHQLTTVQPFRCVGNVLLAV